MRISDRSLRKCSSPSPISALKRWLAGTKQSLKATSEVGSAQTPIFSMGRPITRPSDPFSTKKMVSLSSVPARAKTVKKSATAAEVTQV